MSKERKIATNCEKATFIIEKKKTAALSLKENLELTIHLAGCEVCRIYQRQSKIIDKVAFDIFVKPVDKEVQLDKNYKEKLQKTIDEKSKNI